MKSLQKRSAGYRGSLFWGDQCGSGSHAETGRLSGYQRGQEKRNTAEQTIATRAKRDKRWHSQGPLRDEEEGTWERALEEEAEEVRRARSGARGFKAMLVVYSKGSRKLPSDYKWKDGGLGLSRWLGQQDEKRS